MQTNNKLRDALMEVCNKLLLWNYFDDDTAKMCLALHNKCDKALSEPVRNYEVGTVKEQAERFDAFCQSNMKFYRDMFGHDDDGRLDGWDCREDCPVGRMIDSGAAVPDHCQLAWAQMPYEGGTESEDDNSV